MSWNDSDIDQLFKGAKAPEPPPFEEAFWTEMEAMLPEEKRRKAGFWWFSGGAAMLLALGITFFWLNGSDAHPAKQAPAVTEAETPPAQHPFAEMHADLSETEPAAGAVDGKSETALPTGQMGNRPADRPDGNNVSTDPNEGRSNSQHPVSDAQLATTGISDAPEDLTSQHSTFNIEHSTAEIPDPLPVADAWRGIRSGTPAVSRTLPGAVFPKPERFYLQASMGVGQSAQRNVPAASDLLHYYAIGGGLYKRIDRMVLTFGLTGRVDFTRNVVNSQTDLNSGVHRIDTRYSQLYSFETPVSLGFNYGRNTFGATLTPGFQSGFTGNQSEYQDQVMVRSGHVAGKVQDSKTLTMEIGVNYWRTVQPNWYLGVAFNVDAIRPFNPGTFNGQQRMLPMNGQLTLRRTF